MPDMPFHRRLSSRPLSMRKGSGGGGGRSRRLHLMLCGLAVSLCTLTVVCIIFSITLEANGKDVRDGWRNEAAISKQRRLEDIARFKAETKALETRIKTKRERMRQIVNAAIRVFEGMNITEKRHAVESALKHFDDEPVITIRGFYSSGTNWLRALIRKNCPKLIFDTEMPAPFPQNHTLDVDGIYGWKHGLFKEKEIKRFKRNKKHVLVILSREAPTWVVSAWKMHAMTQEPSPARPQTKIGRAVRFARGVLSKVSIGLERNEVKVRKEISAYIARPTTKESGVHDFFLRQYYDDADGKEYDITSDHVMDARTKVYQNWLAVRDESQLNPATSGRVYLLRYEDLLSNTYHVFAKMIRSLGVPCEIPTEQSFDPVSSRQKMGRTYNDVQFNAARVRNEFCSKANDDKLYTEIINRINPELETKLGYTYPAHVQEYCSKL